MNFEKYAANLTQKVNKTKKFLDNLKSLSIEDKKKECEDKLKLIGNGSSRKVYKLFDNTVIKIAKNKKGIAQNKVEASQKEINKSINRVLYFSEDYSFIRVGYSNTINKSKFKELTGYSFDDYSVCLKWALKNLTKKEVKEPNEDIFEEISKEDFFKDIVKYANKLNLVPGDLVKITSYGEKSDRLVLIDYGLSREVYNLYYKKNKS